MLTEGEGRYKYGMREDEENLAKLGFNWSKQYRLMAISGTPEAMSTNCPDLGF